MKRGEGEGEGLTIAVTQRRSTGVKAKGRILHAGMCTCCTACMCPCVCAPVHPCIRSCIYPYVSHVRVSARASVRASVCKCRCAHLDAVHLQGAIF